MTCIMGIVCEDGIVLVGDKKIKAGPMAHYENKLIPIAGYQNLVVAAAGFTDVRDKFIKDMENLPVLLKKGIIKEDPSRGSVGLVEDIAFRLMIDRSSRKVAHKYKLQSSIFDSKT